MTLQTLERDRTHVDSERAKFGIDKIERYDWKLLDKPGKFQAIDKDLLEFDHKNYQRINPQDSKILDIAREWSWIGCGCILVAKRVSNDGGNARYFVMEGQYRTLAARRRSDIKVLPCMVYDVGGISAEALGFLIANTFRKPIRSADRHKARVTSGDQNAIFVRDLLTTSSREADAACYTVLYKAARDSRLELTAVWPLLDKLCSGRAIHNHLLQALVYIERHMQEGKSLADSKWSERVLEVGYDGLLEQTRKASAMYAKGGARVWAEGALLRINKGLRNKLVLA